MRISVSFTALGHSTEFYLGGGTDKYDLLALSLTVLTLGIKVSIKI